MIQWGIVGDSYGQQHILSMFIHAVTALMLFFCFRIGTGKTWESGLCATLFALHPINVETVAWLASLTAILESFFLAFALLCYLLYIRRPSLIRYILPFLPFILGLLCRPTIAVLPLLLLCLDYWPFRRAHLDKATYQNISSWVKSALGKIPFMLIAIFLLAIKPLLTDKTHAISNNVPINFHPGGIIDFALYLKNIFYPTNLTICYPSPLDAPLWAAIGVFIILILAICVIVAKTRFNQSHGYILAGWSWFIIASLPVLIMVCLSDRPVADRHMYTPFIGIFIIISFGLGDIIRSVKYGKAIFIPLVFIGLLMLGITSYAQTKNWKNSITIFNHALSINPTNKKALSNLGDAFIERKDIGKAIRTYQKLVKITPKSARAHTKLAYALSLEDKDQQAEEHYQKALILSTEYEFAHHNYADYLADQGKAVEAIEHYQKALSINPALFRTHNNLATVLIRTGDIPGAVDHLNKALRINPDYKTARDNLSMIPQKY